LVSGGYRSLGDLKRMSLMDWQTLDGFGRNSANKMRNQIKAVLDAPLEDWKLIAALNIPGIGVSLAKRMCDVFEPAEFNSADWTKVEGIGASRAAEIETALQSIEWLDLLTSFQYVVTKGSLSAPLIVMTGTGPQPRAELEKIAIARGFRLGKAVTKATALLVCADVNGGSSKLKKARGYGVETKTYEEWL
jgi:NAD-dependent DNA ligase